MGGSGQARLGGKRRGGVGEGLLPDDHSPDHVHPFYGCGRKCVGFTRASEPAGHQGHGRWLIAEVAGNGPYYIALPADKLVLVPRTRSSTRYTVGRETENSSANSAIVCFPPWWSWTKWACWRTLSLGCLPQPALGASDGHALAGAQAQQVDLELGKGGQDVEEHLAHRVGRVVDRATEG